MVDEKSVGYAPRSTLRLNGSLLWERAGTPSPCPRKITGMVRPHG